MAHPDLSALLQAGAAAEAGHAWLSAAGFYDQALRIAPRDHRLHCNRANALWLADQPLQALQGFQAAVQLAPTEPLPWRGLGNALRDANHFGAACAAYARSAALQDDPLTAWNRSQVLIGLERYRQAFALAERRLEVPALQPHRPGPGWSGDCVELRRAADAGVALQVWTEQGLGDSFQFLRWLLPLGERLVAAAAPAPLVIVEPPLVPLWRAGLAWLPRPPRVLPKGQEPVLPQGWSQHHVSLLSLPHRLGLPHPSVSNAAEGPLLRLGALAAPPVASAAGLRVGILWAAGRKLEDSFTAREYQRRSLAAAALGILVEGLQRAGAQLVALQHGADHERIEPWGGLVLQALAPAADFLATARLVQSLDLVITVDTAMAHMAGCLGRPCWVLLPWSADPRWLRGRSDCVWYPSLRLFRQPRPGAWEPLIADVLSVYEAQAGEQLLVGGAAVA